MSFSNRASASAARFVSHFSSGSKVTIKDPSVTFTAATRTGTPATAFYEVDCSRPVPYAQRLVDGARIRTDDLVTFIWEANPDILFTPKPDMLAVFGSDSYRIVGVQVNQGSYELQLRGGGA